MSRVGAATPAARFILVGCVAAAVHFSIVVALVRHWGAGPLGANVVGWLIAFSVSFGGHYRWTFRSQQAPLTRSALRFFTVSALGFIVNESAYASLLHWSGLRFDVTLGLVLLAVAGLTFVLGRHWAFLGTPAPPSPQPL